VSSSSRILLASGGMPKSVARRWQEKAHFNHSQN
jgi:hypothetical protein